MTALTKQLTNAELRQIIDSHEKGHAMVAPIDYGYLAAKQLLAVREAKPVAWQQNWTGNDWQYCSKPMFDYLTTHPEPLVEIRSLYTAPPAPAVTAELLDAMAEVIRISDRDHEAWDRAKIAISAFRAAKPVAPIEMTGALAMTKYGIKRSNYTQWVKGWNACRAAMLNHSGGSNEKAEHVSQGYTLNSPVIPDCCSVKPTYAAPSVPTDQLINIANHIAGSADGLPVEWQDWASELVSDLRRLAASKVDPVVPGDAEFNAWVHGDYNRGVTLSCPVNLGIAMSAWKGCCAAMLSTVPDEIDIFVDQVCGNLPAGHQQ